ncbi:VOC family protein [Streptomyces sp. NPDC019645]|uniref:VOC family protein n=1 Tax=unclassified Streptomyces TaxID=2593676 RepID=UPI00340FF1DC
MDLKLEVIVLPVADTERAKAFYHKLGFRLDLDTGPSTDFRGVHFTPPGSGCSIMFGEGMTAAEPGSVQGLYLIVSDINAARAELADRGIEISDVFHDANGVLFHGHARGDVTHNLPGQERLAGRHPEGNTYSSYASFADPDGNGWVLQEITERFPGR